MKKYKEELIRSMNWLADQNDTIFIGQSVSYSGNAIYNTLASVPENKRLELPVFEEVQMGMSIGMAMNGLTPISCFPRFDFLMRCMDSLVNHLDKMQTMTEFTYRPRVIIRTSIGSKNPLDGGVQHTQDYTNEMKSMLSEVKVVRLEEPDDIFEEFKRAYYRAGSTLFIEHGDYYNDK